MHYNRHSFIQQSFMQFYFYFSTRAPQVSNLNILFPCCKTKKKSHEQTNYSNWRRKKNVKIMEKREFD